MKSIDRQSSRGKRQPRRNDDQNRHCPILNVGYAISEKNCPLFPVLQQLPIGVVICDKNGVFTTFNREAERILGMGAQQVGPSHWSKVYGLYLPDKMTPFPSEALPLSRALRGEEVSGEVIFVKNPSQQEGVWIHASSRPFTHVAGQVGSAVVVFNDVTKSRRAIKTIELLSKAVEQTADSILISDPAGIIQYVNPAFELTTGYSSNDVVGQTPRMLKSGLQGSEFYRDLWQCILDGNVFRGTLVNRKKSGEFYWAEQTITPIKDSAGNISQFVSVLKDITDIRKQQEHEIQLQLARQAQQKFYAPPVAHPSFDIGRAIYPAIEIGGDYIDFIPISNVCLSIAVGDVSGHGFDSALLMALTRAYVRSYSTQHLELSDIMAGVNRMLLADLEEDRYVTLLMVQADALNSTLSYASAGHVPGFVLGRAGQIEALIESTGMPLGLFEPYRIETKLIEPTSGSITVLLTDGASEASDPMGEPLGLDRIVEYVRAHRAEPAQHLADGLCQFARRFTGGPAQQDDIAAVILKAHDRS